MSDGGGGEEGLIDTAFRFTPRQCVTERGSVSGGASRPDFFLGNNSRVNCPFTAQC